MVPLKAGSPESPKIERLGRLDVRQPTKNPVWVDAERAALAAQRLPRLREIAYSISRSSLPASHFVVVA